jgi:hypothetical protein
MKCSSESKSFTLACGHCEDETRLSVKGPDGLYCDMDCYRAHRRHMFTPMLVSMTNTKEDTDVDLMDYLTKMVKEGKGSYTAVDSLQFYRDQLKPVDQLKMDLESAEIPKYFWSSKQTIRETLDRLKKEKKNMALRRKTIQFILNRNARLYFLFKTKLLEEWVELLEMSDNDKEAQETASSMKQFHSILESCEVAFFSN